MIPSTLLSGVPGRALLFVLFGSPLLHPSLLSSSPEAGEVLERAPAEIRLIFSEPVSRELSSIQLEGPSGPVTLGDLTRHPDSAAVLIIPITGSMPAGAYSARWTAVGDDGHPVAGTLSFRLEAAVEDRPGARGGAEGGASSSRAPPDTSVSGATEAPEASPRGGVEEEPREERLDVRSPVYTLVRWVNLAGIIAGLGSLAFGLFVIPGAERSSGRTADPSLANLPLRAGVAASILILVMAAARLLAQRAAVFGSGFTLDLAHGTRALLTTSWGAGWGLQLVGGAWAVLGFRLARSRKRGGWGLAVAGLLMVAVSPALSGHAAAGDSPLLRILVDSLHVLGAGGWIGGLLVLLLAAALANEERQGAVRVADLVRAFSPLAILFAGLLVMTGAVGAVSHLERLDQLWGSPYGRVLLLKVLLFLLVAAAGAYNNLRMRPALARGASLGRFRLSAGAELALAVAVLLVTSILVATPTPGESLAAMEVGRAPSAGPSRDEERVAERVRAFHRALEEGDSVTAVSLLATDALILEGGGVESREEYLAHHLRADMAFASGVERSAEMVRVTVLGDAAWVVSSTHSVGSVGERPVDSRGAELVVLSREGGVWQIRAIHWSARR